MNTVLKAQSNAMIDRGHLSMAIRINYQKSEKLFGP